MRYLSVALGILVLLAAGCDLGGTPPTASPPATPVLVTPVPPTGPATASPPVPVTTAESPFVQAGAALDTLPSYRWTARWTLTSSAGDQVSPLSWHSEGIRVKDGDRWHITWALGEGDVVLEVIHIGNQEWVRFGEQWVETPAGQQRQFLGFTPRGWWDDVGLGLEEHTRRVMPDEQVNGVLCQHYRTSESYRGVVVSGGVNWSHQGDIWLAVAGGYPVRGRFLGTGVIESATWTLTQELDITHVGDAANVVNPPR